MILSAHARVALLGHGLAEIVQPKRAVALDDGRRQAAEDLLDVVANLVHEPLEVRSVRIHGPAPLRVVQHVPPSAEEAHDQGAEDEKGGGR